MAPRWYEDRIAGHAVDLFEPSRPHSHGFTVIYLHGVHLGRLPGNAHCTALLEQHGLRLAAPITQRSWWTDRICDEFDPACSAEQHLLRRVMPYLKEKWGAVPTQIALWGTSMGGQGALRFAFKHPNVFPVAAAVSPAIDYQTRLTEGDETLYAMYGGDPERARQDTATLHVHPLNWPRHTWFCCDPADPRWLESAERLQMKLSSLGIPHQYDFETTGGGHGWDYYNRMAGPALEFVVHALERERLRVV